MTTDERNTYFWKKEQDAVTMAEAARLRGDTRAEKQWLQEAERCRRGHWPKDRGYIPKYVTS